MLTESFIAATLASSPSPRLLSSTLKDVGIFQHEVQPQSVLRHGFKKSSVEQRCLAISDSHVFAAQSAKPLVNVYSRDSGQQEATVPFPERIRSIAHADGAGILVLGTESGKLLLWEVATGRISTSAASHLQGISHVCTTPGNDYILTCSADATAFVWSLSKLVSLSQQSDLYSNDSPSNEPVGTFSQHRSPISALGCGRSNAATNLAVTASTDQTCHVWHIESCQVLRTILLPSIALCVALDPADRALYFGDDAGNITSFDLFSAGLNPPGLAIGPSTPAPIQLTSGDSWEALLQPGRANCVTLSYDGTMILTGHDNGAVIQWDAAKHRMISEVVSLGQPVTNLHMLRPRGLKPSRQRGHGVETVVKSRFDLNTGGETGSLGVPASYTFRTSLSGRVSDIAGQSESKDLQAVRTSGWPCGFVEEAARALDMVTVRGDQPTGDSERNRAKIAQLEKEVDQLRQRLASVENVHQQRIERKAARMDKRLDLGVKRREAYFEAEARGENGNAAIKVFEQEEDKLDEESADDLMDDGSA